MRANERKTVARRVPYACARGGGSNKKKAGERRRGERWRASRARVYAGGETTGGGARTPSVDVDGGLDEAPPAALRVDLLEPFLLLALWTDKWAIERQHI